jgi:hypothetical protein
MGNGNHFTGSSVGPKAGPGVLGEEEKLLPMSSNEYATFMLKQVFGGDVM